MSANERLSRRQFLKQAAALSGAGLLAACAVPPPPAPVAGTVAPTAAGAVTPALAGPVQGGELAIAELADILVYDPHLASNDFVTNLTDKICDLLVYLDPKDKQYKPGLSSSYEVAPDGTSITFKLRQDVTFHDGTRFDAKAVQFNMDRIANPATGAQAAAFLLGPYDKTEVVDDYTARIMYKAPYAPGLDSFSLGFFAIVSPAAVQKFGQDFARNPVGSGPFMWSEYARDDHVSMVRNPNYKWASSIFSNPGPAYLEKVTYKYSVDQAVRAGMLRNGQVHILEGVPESEVANFKREGFVVYESPSPGIPGIAHMNTTLAPTDDIRVRQAIIYGTDRNAIVKVAWADVWKPAYGPLTKTTFGYDPAVESYYQYDPAKAKALLEEAGWKPGPDGIRVKDGKRLEVSLIYAIGSWQWTEIFQAQMKEIGVDIKILQMEMLASGQASAKGEANISPNIFPGSDPAMLSLVFHSRSIGLFNWTFYKDPKLDQLIEAGVTQMDKTQRAKTYSDVQKIIMDNALIIPLADTYVMFVVRPEVQGLIVDPRGIPMWVTNAWLKPS